MQKKTSYVLTDHAVKVLIPPIRTRESDTLDHVFKTVLPVLLHGVASVWVPRMRLHSGQLYSSIFVVHLLESSFFLA